MTSGKIGRPCKYTSDEERKRIAAKRARDKYAEERDTVRSYKRDPSAEKYRGTKAYRLYHGAKTRAKKSGLPFDLDVEFIHNLLEHSKLCPLLNMPYDDDKYMQSLDKKIPELGYIKSNVWIISYRANAIKNDASIEELELLVRNLKEKF